MDSLFVTYKQNMCLRKSFIVLLTKGDCEAVGEDFHADVYEGCMNIDGNEFMKFKIPDSVKDANIKKMAKDSAQEAYLLLKRDIDVVVHTYRERLDEAIKRLFKMRVLCLLHNKYLKIIIGCLQLMHLLNM
ncbi:uncharacterized protein LOC130801641 [Amaranthus tricolor]|uniref:uncharacterized protein LOC130801641 n=1 Tax=Amaranthus tricolor TaxID=29722 RepID=UPI00258F76DD|nr:uncharacterized protein LOC130801641 [Amaranthus tricolor]